jgi:hypothetical protein
VEGAERVDDLHEVGAFGRSAEQTEPQGPCEAPRGGVRLLEHAREVAAGRADFVAKPRSIGGELNASARSVDQLSSELVLELAKALAHTRRRQSKPLRRTAEVQLLGEGEEDPQLAEVDRLPHGEVTLHDAFTTRPLIGGLGSASLGRTMNLQPETRTRSPLANATYRRLFAAQRA